MSDNGVPGARERLRRALEDYAGRRRAMAAARPAPDEGTRRAGPGAATSGQAAVRRRAGVPLAAVHDERGLRALAKEIKALISEDSRRGIGVG